jgi:hypothetical protein
MTTILSMTKLEAVNICLSVMGQPKVTDLSGSAVDAEIAADLIDEVSREVQNKGWHWNREQHELPPTAGNEIVVPDNAIRIDTDRTDLLINVTVRGNRLFNLTDNTYTFTTPVKVGFIVYLEFDELPASAKDFIAKKAARLFQERMLGSTTLTQFQAEDLARLWAEMQREDIAAGDYNALRDNYTVATMINRGSFARGNFR